MSGPEDATPADVHRSVVQYPGGLAARYRWTGSGGIAAITALSEVGGTLTDHGHLISDDPDRLCRAELRVEGPLGTWTARFASVISEEATADQGLYGRLLQRLPGGEWEEVLRDAYEVTGTADTVWSQGGATAWTRSPCAR